MTVTMTKSRTISFAKIQNFKRSLPIDFSRLQDPASNKGFTGPDRHRARFLETKIQSAALYDLYISCALDFFSESALDEGPWNDVYFFSTAYFRGAESAHIGICHLKWTSQDTFVTFYLHILFSFSRSQLWRHQRWFWIFFFRKCAWWWSQKFTDKGWKGHYKTNCVKK